MGIKLYKIKIYLKNGHTLEGYVDENISEPDLIEKYFFNDIMQGLINIEDDKYMKHIYYKQEDVSAFSVSLIEGDKE